MTYINNIFLGLVIFPLIAAVFTMPYALYQYNRHGSVSKFRTLIIYSFILYMMIAFFMVSLPLPDPESTAGNRWQDHLNLIPFKQIWMYWHNRTLNMASIKAYLTSMSLWQLLFNILLTVPFGIYMRYYFKLSLKRTAFYSFLLSLFYEMSQITALFGIYPGPYRLADVEDLICNTLGGVAGWQTAFLFMTVLPKREEIDAECRAESRKITGMRRIWSALFDYIGSYILFTFLLGAAEELIPDFDNSLIFTYDWSFFCLFSLIQVILTRGSTLGHGICRMVIISADGRTASAGQLFMRYLYLWLFTDLPLILREWLTGGQFQILNHDLVILALYLISRLYYIMYMVNVVFKKGRLMPHDRLSRTRYMAIAMPKQNKE